MREKLLDLMRNEGLKPSQLADMLSVNPAGISHILAGRNKPGFDLLQKILRRFPRINPDWLLLDTGPMYRDTKQPDIATPSDLAIPDHSDEAHLKPTTPAGDLFASQSTDQPENRPTRPASATTPAPANESLLPKMPNRSATVKRVVIFYDDDSFEAYFPTVHCASGHD